jgi:hypothetical protein
MAADVGIIVGAGGFALAVLREMMAARERRARPVAVCHEASKRNLQEVATVYVTNESAASAFNIRFGINMGGTHIGWKHSRSDPEPSRLNVLRPGDREPAQGVQEIVIPDAVLWSMSDRDPDEGRSYWAYYQSPGGDWWLTSNPASRSEDLTIKRIRSRRFGVLSRRKRALDRRLREGAEIEHRAVRELRERS